MAVLRLASPASSLRNSSRWRGLMSPRSGTVRRFPATSALLALPLRGMKLVVLSACESGVVQVRISNEIYGFSWVLLAGGAENAVTSRWRVDGASNGKWMQSFYSAIASGFTRATNAS